MQLEPTEAQNKARQHQIGHDCIEGKGGVRAQTPHAPLSKAKWWQRRVICSILYKQEQKIHRAKASYVTQISLAAYKGYKKQSHLHFKE